MQLRLVRFRLMWVDQHSLVMAHRILILSHEILDTILNEAKQLYKHAKVNTISVYTTTL